MLQRRSRLWLVGILLAVVALGLACNRRKDKDDAPNSASKAQDRVSKTPEGDPLLRLEPETQIRIGLRTKLLEAETRQSEIVAYGRLEEDPSRSFTLRAPISGTLHFAPGRDWPSIGEHLLDGAAVGAIEPRIVPTERITLTSQLATFQSELSASTASTAAARSAYERARILNADNKNVSDRVVEEAASHLKAEEARQKAASDTVRLLENSLKSAGPTGNKLLVIERGGDVVEITAHPGEAVEPGAPILRVAKLDRLIARVDIPVGQHVPAAALSARIVPVGYEDQPISAERVAVSPAVDVKAQGESFLLRLSTTPFGLRPGVAVTAYLGGAGPRKQGVVIPGSALVRMAGRVFVYIQTAPDHFVRKEVLPGSPMRNGYFVTGNVSAGNRVVTQGGQILLSEEFKSQTAVEE